MPKPLMVLVTVVIFVVIGGVFLKERQKTPDTPAEQLQPTQTVYSVVLHGCGENGGTFENTSSSNRVHIRHVRIADTGEVTQEMFALSPRTKKHIHQDLGLRSFYIYNDHGGLIG